MDIELLQVLVPVISAVAGSLITLLSLRLKAKYANNEKRKIVLEKTLRELNLLRKQIVKLEAESDAWKKETGDAALQFATEIFSALHYLHPDNRSEAKHAASYCAIRLTALPARDDYQEQSSYGRAYSKIGSEVGKKLQWLENIIIQELDKP